MKIAREWLLLLGALLVIAALYNHYLGHSAYLVEIVFIAVGAGLGLYSLYGMAAEVKGVEDGLLIRILTRYITKEQCVILIPLTGFVLIIAWSIWKLFVVGETNLRMEDFIVTLFGLSLVLYYAGPSRFTMQKDFVVLYLLFLTIVFAVIWKVYTIVTGESYVRITAYAEYYFITSPVASILHFIGVNVHTELDLSGYGLSNIIYYEYEGRLAKLGVGTSCSGLYSAGLFFSAFLAFVLVRYRKVDRYILTALGIGFAVTWFSNIIRMVITILVGSKFGHPALVFVHSYIGIIIFVTFITIFWFLIVRWLDRVEKEPGTAQVLEGEAAPQKT